MRHAIEFYQTQREQKDGMSGMVRCRRRVGVLRCCLLGFFCPLLLGKSWFCRGQKATQFSSLFIFSSRQAVTRASLCVMSREPRKEGLKAEILYFNKAFTPRLLTRLKRARFKEADRKLGPTGHPACCLHLTGLIRDENRDKSHYELLILPVHLRGMIDQSDKTVYQVCVNGSTFQLPFHWMHLSVCLPACEMTQVWTSWC